MSSTNQMEQKSGKIANFCHKLVVAYFGEFATKKRKK
jgi:hypothetical protein